jgi:hypothetical protein
LPVAASSPCDGLAHGRRMISIEGMNLNVYDWHGRFRIRPPLGHAPIVVRH